jgi:hypothetical protein
MKSKQNPYGPLNRSIRFWAYHTGYSVPSLSRWLKAAGIRASRRKADPGVTLSQIWTAIDYH